jgi:hypothetical protein
MLLHFVSKRMEDGRPSMMGSYFWAQKAFCIDYETAECCKIDGIMKRPSRRDVVILKLSK